jgi:putative phosphoesterase
MREKRRMVVGVVSDTHFPRFGEELPPALARGLRAAGVERILHCGDMTELLVIPLLEAIAPVEAVAGNNDGPEIRERYGRRRVVEIEGVRIGMVHGDGRKRTPDEAFTAFAPGTVDAICFGHSHIPTKMMREGVLMVNPGSPSDKRMNPLYSYALLKIEDGTIAASLHYYPSRK